MQGWRSRLSCAALLAAALSPPTDAQQTPPRPSGLPADAGTGAIAGRVFDASLGAPLPGTQTSANGAYRLRRLPPGDYQLVALLDPEDDSWLDAEVLSTFVAAAVPIRVNAGEQRWQDLRIGR